MTKEELFAVMEQIAEEREVARPIVEDLIASGESLEDIEIPDGWRTAGMVLELCDMAYSKNESFPLASLRLAQVALPISMSLSTSTSEFLSKYLEARAWKEVGYANRYLCNYSISLDGYSHAENIFSELGLAYQIATTQMPRAGTLFMAYREEECVKLTAEARIVFQEFADVGQEGKCDVFEAMVAWRQGRFEAASHQCEALIEHLTASDDLHTLGITYQCLGLARSAQGQIREAVTAFSNARQIFLALEMPSEVNRADWGLGQILLDEGKPDRALPIFTRLRDDYLKRKMPEEAAELGLWIVDALVASGRTQDAYDLVEGVLKEFVAAKSHKNAITALSYLRDVMHMSANPTREIRRVRSYVEKLRAEPDLIFLPHDDFE